MERRGVVFEFVFYYPISVGVQFLEFLFVIVYIGPKLLLRLTNRLRKIRRKQRREEPAGSPWEFGRSNDVVYFKSL